MKLNCSETADLLVNVIEAKELVGPDPCSKTPFDSYVRVYLLPDKTTNMQTRVSLCTIFYIYLSVCMVCQGMNQ